jgi:hypothetical protein
MHAVVRQCITSPCLRAISIATRLWVWLLCPSKLVVPFPVISVSHPKCSDASIYGTLQNPFSFCLDSGKQCLVVLIWEALCHNFPGINQLWRNIENTRTYCIHTSYIVPLLALWDGSNLMFAFLWDDFLRTLHDYVLGFVRIENPRICILIFINNILQHIKKYTSYAPRLCWTQKL